MILQEVQNFDNYPDGRLRAGPFPGAPDQIARHLERHDLHIGALGEKGMCSRTIMGTMISAAGAGVNGYLLDGEGLEAASSDIEAFLDAVIRIGTTVTIEGHHCPDDMRMVRSVLRAWRSGRELLISTERVLHTRDGGRVDLMRQPPMPLGGTGPEGTPQLSLVG
ncbi:MAG: hypothetical protein CMO01_00535 [Thalassobius sp.]|nr:hypothetical protein [Thalassovita sp.]